MPARDEVDLWTVALTAGADDLARARELLSDAERERLTRVIRPLAQERMVLSRAALRTILAGYLQIDPRRVALTGSASAKPRLEPDPGLCFSLSHSGEVAVVAVTTRAAVGVDIEALGRHVGLGVLRRALTAPELARVLSRPESERDESFLRLWTAREAYLKAIGIGLAGADAAKRNAEPPATGWSLQRFDPGPGTVGTVAVAGGPWIARGREIGAAGHSEPGARASP